MIRRPEWYDKEYNELLDKWAEEDTDLDFPEYLEKYMSERSKKIHARSQRVSKKNDGKGHLCLRTACYQFEEGGS